MSNKKHNNTNNNNANVTVNNVDDEVTMGVAPEEGVNSINETEETEADAVVLADQDVSVADTQESEVTGQEDGTATNDEDTNVSEQSDETTDESTADVTVEEPDATPKVDDVKPEEPKVVTPEIKKVQAKGSGYFISLGEVQKLNMELVTDRLKKAGIDSTSFIGDELVVGPFATMEVCIVSRKKVVSKGLKCRIVEK